MPPPGGHDQRSGRHAEGYGQSGRIAGQRWTHAARGGLFTGAALILATVLSRLLFHGDFLGSYGFRGFVTDIFSGVLALVGLALVASFMAPIWKQASRRFGRPSGRRADG